MSRRLVGCVDSLPPGGRQKEAEPWQGVDPKTQPPWSRPRMLIGTSAQRARLAHRLSPTKHPIYNPYNPFNTCRYHRDAAASSLGTPLPLRRMVARRLIARPRPPSAARRTQSIASQRSFASSRWLSPLPDTDRGPTLRLHAAACDSTRSDWRYWQCGEPGVSVGLQSGHIWQAGYAYGLQAGHIWLLTGYRWLLAGAPCSAQSRCHSRPWSSHVVLSKNHKTAVRGVGRGGGTRKGKRASGGPPSPPDYSEGRNPLSA